MTDTPVTTEGTEKKELRKISDEELERVLDKHKKWLEKGKNGEGKADLSNTDLTGRDFSDRVLEEANFSGSYLSETNFSRANLRKSNFFFSHLGYANLSLAVLDYADLSSAVLISADLSEAIASNANFNNAHLLGAKLRGADLRYADLTKADLKGADISGANFSSTNFRWASFWKSTSDENTVFDENEFSYADLPDMDLSAASGLLSRNFAGAIIPNITPPRSIDFGGLKIVEETSKHARNIFLAMIAACVFCWLTIATTTDLALITNASTTPLPIINTKIPIAGFYWFAPIILLAAYIYLHLYLQRMWEGLAELPAVFPDGRRLDQTAYPWLLSGLVTAHMPTLKDRRPPLSRLQNFISIVLAWWLVPLTLIWFWGRYLPRQDWFGTVLITFVLTAISVCWHYTYRLAKQTLSGALGENTRSRLHYKAFLKRSRPTQLFGPAVFSLCLLLSFGAIEGTKFSLGYRPNEFQISPATWVPTIFASLGIDVFANFREQDISIRPPTWTGIEFAGVKRALLQNANLRNADGTGAFLVNANLRGANMRRINLSGANLANADLASANLEQADLHGARIQNANLNGAVLNQAQLYDALLQFANLSGARLDNTNLRIAYMHGTNLRQAQLSKADLSGAYLMCGEFKTPQNTTRKICADLSNADLSGAKLACAIRSDDGISICTNLSGANLAGANLSGVDLTRVLGLSNEQLNKACGDEKTRLPKHIKMKLKRCPKDWSPHP